MYMLLPKLTTLKTSGNPAFDDISPTPTSGYYPVISRGDDSNRVMNMQIRLRELGYLDDRADGIYGNNTAAAVAQFQARAGLPVNGDVADSATQKALYADDAPSN